jgi:site-specific DNA recombinase
MKVHEGYRTKKNRDFSINGVKTILSNPLYVGLIRYNVRRDWSEKRRNNINPDPVIEKGQPEPIITEEVWDKTKSIMASRGGKPNRIHSGEFPLTGIMKCPTCGSGMVLGRTTNRYKNVTKRVLEYYVCGAWKNKGSTVCRSNGIRTHHADEYVLKRITDVANNDVLIKGIVEKINEMKQSDSSPIKKEYEAIKKSLSSIKHKKDKVLELYEEGVILKQTL